MSADPKLDIARGWRSVMDLREAEADRLAELSDDDFERAMADLPSPGHVPTIDEIVAQGRASSHHHGRAVAPAQAAYVSVDRQGPSLLVWALAAAFLLALGVGVAERRAVVAFFKPAPEAPSPAPTAPPGPTPFERAEALRGDAREACNRGDWGSCSDELDKAKTIDPAGESTPGVRQLRQKVTEGLRPQPLEQDKPLRP